MTITMNTLETVRRWAGLRRGQSLDIGPVNVNGLVHIAVVNDDGSPQIGAPGYLVQAPAGGIYPVSWSRPPYKNFRGEPELVGA
jgi:hypothetical protein